MFVNCGCEMNLRNDPHTGRTEFFFFVFFFFFMIPQGHRRLQNTSISEFVGGGYRSVLVHGRREFKQTRMLFKRDYFQRNLPETEAT